MDPKKNEVIIDHETGLVTTQMDPIVRPAVSPEQALQAWEDYQTLKRRVINEKEDIETIKGKDFLKKSGWRKLASFFNLSVEEVKEKKIKEEDGSFSFDVTYRAIAPNGRTSSGDGSANSHEKKDKFGKVIVNSRHNVRGTAHTRAFNRAVSNLIGGGEVSWEEANQEPAPTVVPMGPKEFKFQSGTYKNKGFEEIPIAELVDYMAKIKSTDPIKYKRILDLYDSWRKQKENEDPETDLSDLKF